MADLLSHALVPYLLVGAWANRDRCFWAVQGGVLPDLVARVPSVLLLGGEVAFGPGAFGPIDRWLYGIEALHAPAGLGPLVIAIAAGVPLRWMGDLSRAHCAAFLGIGVVTHLLIDAMQRHLRPSYAFFWPFDDRAVEWGIIGTEDSLLALPVLGSAAFLLHRWRRQRAMA